MTPQDYSQVELAKDTLQVFRDQGEELSEPRHVMHFFYGNDVSEMRKALEKLNYTTHSDVEQEYWAITERHRAMAEAGCEFENLTELQCLVGERHEIIGEAWRTSVLVQLSDLSKKHDVEYDGWQASLETHSSSQSNAAGSS